MPHRPRVARRSELPLVVAANRDEYMRRVDETAFHYAQELPLGTFEGVW